MSVEMQMRIWDNSGEVMDKFRSDCCGDGDWTSGGAERSGDLGISKVPTPPLFTRLPSAPLVATKQHFT